MSRAGVYTTMPPDELQRKIAKAREAIANQKPRVLKCPYCKHNSIIVYGDTRGHVQSKCSKCGRTTVFDVLSMRRVKSARYY